MKPCSTRLLLQIGMLLALGCGARTPLDLPDNDGTNASGGSGGNPASGVPGSGGHAAGSGGMMNLGGMMGSGGRPGTGGNPGYGGTYRSGGSPGTGGRISTGGVGSGGNVGGNAGANVGGNMGGQTGFVAGGSPGTGGRAIGTGGRPGTGGRGGAGGGMGGITSNGGSINTGGAVGTGGGTCPGLAANEELIDDLSDGNRFIPTVSGRVGSWADSDDGTPGGAMYPDPVNPFTPTDSGDACHKFAAYVKGAGFSDWGSNLWFGLGSPYNASKYTGISFWARIDAGTKDVIHVTFPDKDTIPDGGICQTNTTGATACYDHYGTRPTFTTVWKKYTISFRQLTQDGWGHQGTAFDPSSLYQVLFQISVNATFSLWIDDVAFTM